MGSGGITPRILNLSTGGQWWIYVKRQNNADQTTQQLFNFQRDSKTKANPESKLRMTEKVN
jgi:hypothetical protein